MYCDSGDIMFLNCHVDTWLKGYANLLADILHSSSSPCNIWLSVDLVQEDI